MHSFGIQSVGCETSKSIPEDGNEVQSLTKIISGINQKLVFEL